jgi:hypothetical protein
VHLNRTDDVLSTKEISYIDKARGSRYYSFSISARIQEYLHTQDFWGASRNKPPSAQGIEASQLGMSSGLQQYPQP